jgi:hypothetical protein
MHDTPNPLVPLALLADAWHTTTATLADQLGPDAVITDQLGIRHTTVTDAAQLLADRKAREQAQRQANEAHRANLDAMAAPLLNRVKALQAMQRQMRHDGQIDADTPAFVAMAAGENEARLSPASRRMDGWLSGRSEGAMFQPQPARKD